MPVREFWNLITEDLPEGAKQRFLLLVMSVFIAIHVSWACGWIPGISGFAMAQDTAEISEEVEQLREALKDQNKELGTMLRQGLDDLKRSQLEGRINSLHVLRCAAERRALQQEYANQIQKLQSEYRRLAGYQYPLERCPAGDP